VILTKYCVSLRGNGNSYLSNTTWRLKKPNAIILKQLLGVRLSFHTIMDTKIMGKNEFNCQLLLSEIELTTDLSNST